MWGEKNIPCLLYTTIYTIYTVIQHANRIFINITVPTNPNPSLNSQVSI